MQQPVGAMAKRTESKSPLLQASEDVVLDVADGWESTRSESFRSRTSMKRTHCRQRGTSRDAVRPFPCDSATPVLFKDLDIRERRWCAGRARVCRRTGIGCQS